MTLSDLDIDLMLRLFVGSVLGGIIGLEREYRSKFAGFRTHFLVALGSSLFMVMSIHGLVIFISYCSELILFLLW